MTVGELRIEIAGLPADMEVGGVGHYGEFLEFEGLNVTEVNVQIGSGKRKTILEIRIESAGEEPE